MVWGFQPHEPASALWDIAVGQELGQKQFHLPTLKPLGESAPYPIYSILVTIQVCLIMQLIA